MVAKAMDGLLNDSIPSLKYQYNIPIILLEMPVYWVKMRPATATTVKPDRPMAKKTGSMLDGIEVPEDSAAQAQQESIRE